MHIHDFVKQLKLMKVFTTKQSVVIDNIFIYIEDLKVYKVVLQVNPSMMKKARRLGVNSEYKTTYFDNCNMKLRFDEDTKHILDKGKYIAIYNIGTTNCSIYPGEDNEIDAVQNAIAPRFVQGTISQG